MNYIEWIKTIGLAIQLLIKSEFGGDVSVQLEWKNSIPGGIVLGENISALCISVYSIPDSAKLTVYYLIPWQNIYMPSRLGNEMVISNCFLKTVTEYAVIYESFSEDVLNEVQKSKLEGITNRVEDLFDFSSNQNILLEEQGLTTPNGIQIIRQREYSYYVEQEIAIPGSKATMQHNFDSIAPGKMIFSHLVPDFGPIKSQWLSHLKIERNSCFQNCDDHFLQATSKGLSKLLSSDSLNTKQVFDDTWNRIDLILTENSCKTDSVKNYYKEHLLRFFSYREEIVYDFPNDNIFGDYVPKRTPDMLSDYMPEAYNEIKSLPNAELQNLSELISLYKKYKKTSRKNPGKWEDGNMILGANPKEYNPSFEEVMLCEAGTRIHEIMQKNSKSDIKRFAKRRVGLSNYIKFKKFSVIHSDVMGSGRFFYIATIEDVKFKLY